MPISLRLPVTLETQIAGFGLRAGISKTAVVVRSIQEFLAKNVQPTSRQLYEDAMREAQQAHVVREVTVEAVFQDGTRMVVVRNPFGAGAPGMGADAPGAVVTRVAARVIEEAVEVAACGERRGCQHRRKRELHGAAALR